jgi:TM2 domain-containing membrane protein YozV
MMPPKRQRWRTRNSKNIDNPAPTNGRHCSGEWHAEHMSVPSQFGSSGGPHLQGQPAPPAGYYQDPAAPFGRHPVTGEPYSDKSKIVAGLLQLLGLFGLVGIGRIYLGQIGYGIVQLLVGWITLGIGALIWGVIDAILILTDKVRDRQGRPLRE